MTSTMIRPRSVSAELREGTGQESRQNRLHAARLGLQLHYQPIRRLFGLGPQLCSMCDKRWSKDPETGVQGCSDRHKSVADFVRFARPAELRWAVEEGFLSEPEVNSVRQALHRQRLAAAAPPSPRPTGTQYHYPLDTGVMRA